MSPTVLIVDDEQDILFMARLVLQGAGYSVLEASGGEEALALIEEQGPDAVLLDLSMAGLDGWGVLKQLKTEGKLERLPVIVLSAHADHDIAQRCIEHGAKDYITKPFRKDHLLRTLEAALG